MSCPHCVTGCLYEEREPFTVDIYIACHNCGWRRVVPMDPPADPTLAVRWEKVLCQCCNIKPARLGLSTCQDCRGMAKCRTQKVA